MLFEKQVKDCGPDSIECIKTTDSKEQIETVNTDIEKDPMGESRALVTRAPEEEKIQDEGILKPTNEREGVDKADESENNREEVTDGDSSLKEIHTVSVGQEIVENVSFNYYKNFMLYVSSDVSFSSSSIEH